jgi:hypothetical protein
MIIARLPEGDFAISTEPHFLWVTEFPLFTRDDADKEHLAHGRWSSSHHPFTAPMWEDIEALFRGDIEEVRMRCPVDHLSSSSSPSCNFTCNPDICAFVHFIYPSIYLFLYTSI